MTDSALVSTDWLQDHLTSPDLVVIDGSYYLPTEQRDPHREYLSARIPGALFFDINKIADPDSELPHMLPRPQAFSSAMRKMGIGDGQQIVVYDGAGMFSAPRVWWTFRTMGARDVFVLNGGLPKWRSEGRALENGPPMKRVPRHFTARFDNTAVRDMAAVQAALADPATHVIDARSSGRFTGEEPEPRPGMRSGHMPGALNLAYHNLLGNGQLPSPDVIRETFQKAGVDLSAPIVTTCGSGVTACVLALALHEIGRADIAVYDGSWAEWGSREDTEVVTGPAP